MSEPADAELRLAEAVLTAAGLDDAERATYLGGLAAKDPDLAARVRRRLTAAEDLPDAFLDVPAAVRLGVPTGGEEAVASAAALPPEERYEIGEMLGEGGMGRVFQAFDRQLGRTVALKLLTHADPEVLRLFLREARAQARVKHEHVLEVYDSGELDGRPFIAMQAAAGGTLEDAAPTLSLEQKVRLLAQAARGLHAAHREGLLHRDVKPSNVLLEPTEDGGLRALVSDFGLAKDLADPQATASGDVAGSPQYIAPERLTRPTGGPDRRSDVYSLGVTLYRLLAGTLPWAGAATVEVLHRIVHEDLPPPRLVAPSLPRELEAVVLRSIARDPEERYASARAVAADLERYLNGEVVEAYAAGLAYRLTRFVLRNKLLVGMAAAVVVALAVSSVAVAVFAWRADAARTRAELRHGQAEELIRFMVVDLRDKLEPLGRLDVLADVGEAATEYFAAVPETELSEAELLRRSRLLYQIGDVRVRQGDLRGAAAPMAESLALARRLAELAPGDGERLFELGQAHFWVGYVAWERGDLEAARGPFEDYLEVSRWLVAKDPTNLDWRRELSYAHSNLGSLLEAEGDLEDALAQFLSTLAIDEELAAADPTPEARSELAATHNTVGVVLETLGRLDEAGEHLRADLEIRQALAAADPEDRRARDFLGASHGQSGIHLSLRGDWPAASEQFEAQRELFTALVAHDPANAAWRYKLAWSHLGLGRAAFARGDLDRANEAWETARRGIDELLDHDATPHKWRRTRAVSLYHLALLAKVRGDGEARDLVLAAVEVLEELAQARPTDREVARWLSQGYLLLGSLERSPAASAAAFERAEAAIAPFTHGTRDGTVLAPWAAALGCLGRHDEARPVAATLQALGYSEPGLADLCRPAAGLDES